jgi:septal ring factor EnvC (AmiA/AmiB activator)
MKMKCTQCGCDDLEEVDFPYAANLVGSEGLSGYSSSYDLEVNLYANTYICTRCGHFEFFNPELAKFVIEERERCTKIQKEIDNFDEQISNKNAEIQKYECQINLITEKIKDIDITIRQSNEFKAQLEELKKKVKELKASKQLLIKEQNTLKKKFNV